jgi:polar amino acid transport system substrate-binding protein
VNRTQPQPTGTCPPLVPSAVARARLRAAVLALAALTAAAVAAGCAAPASPSPSPPPAPAARDAAAPAGAAAAPASPAASAAAPASTGATCNPYASSLAPPPGPPRVTPGSFMAAIKKRGYLIAGVDQNSYNFEYLNPLDGQFQGFDIDMIKAVAQAIFGNADKVEYKVVTDDERIPYVNKGNVDIVAHTMTITCDRLKSVDFSTVYFDAHQQVLVLDSSHATGLNDLGGQPVCATKGSDSVSAIEDYPTHPKVVQLAFFTDCLVQLQQGQVAAISTDNTILAGLKAQDPFTKIVGAPLNDQPYGLAIAKDHQDFVRFVNAVLAGERSSGAWKASYVKWVGSPAPPPPPVGYAS